MLITTRTRLLIGAATLALTASLGASPSLPQTSDTMTVSAMIPQACALATVDNLNFGEITAGADEEKATTFVVSCDFGGSVDISVGPGTGNSGEIPRRMVNGGSSTITYTLWDPEDQQWTPTARTESVIAGDNTFNVIGRIAAAGSENATEGTYEDQVTISISFN